MYSTNIVTTCQCKRVSFRWIEPSGCGGPYPSPPCRHEPSPFLCSLPSASESLPRQAPWGPRKKWSAVSCRVAAETGSASSARLRTFGGMARPRVLVEGPAVAARSAARSAARARATFSSFSLIHDAGSLRFRVLGTSAASTTSGALMTSGAVAGSARATSRKQRISPRNDLALD